MRLGIGDFPVHEVVLGTETGYSDGALTIHADELRARLLEDPALDDVEIDLAKPGESIRIHNIIDVVEPRVRVGEAGTDFPGLLSAPRTVGDGRTHRLKGVAVTEVSEPVAGESTYWRTAVVDMTGPAADLSPFARLNQVVLTFRPATIRSGDVTGAEELNVLSGTPQAMEYGFAVRQAGLKAAVYLAESVRDKEPKVIREYCLDSNGASSLPRIVYLFQAFGVYAYGCPTAAPGSTGPGPLPTIIHPNEVLDGALVNLQTWPACHRDVTYLFQNHPVIEELYRRHGSDLDFRGVVLYTRGGGAQAKERMSSYCANLVGFLGGDAAILTYVGSGHSLVDVMMACQKLEQANVSTIILLPEMAAGADDPGLVYFVPEADAMVSTGNYESPMEFPAVAKVIGGETLFETDTPATGPFSLPIRAVLASTDPLGSWSVRGQQY
jgi:glycine reductase complex component B subunit alpha and beta